LSDFPYFEKIQELLRRTKHRKLKLFEKMVLRRIFGQERDVHRMRVFENRVLRRIFGPKKDEVAGGWRKLHNEELHNLYSSPSIIRMIKSKTMGRTCSTHRSRGF
jgi:hypothetical protein